MVDSSPAFLKEPEKVPAVVEHTVAVVPPIVRMMIVPDMNPEYFFDLEDGEMSYMFAWSNWGKVTRSADNRF